MDNPPGLEEFICGDELGSGLSRTVYVFYPDPTLVIKVETNTGWFQNVREHLMWCDVEWSPLMKRWFAPCIKISPCGRYLLQLRTESIQKKDYKRMPKQVPDSMTDLKTANWGWFDGRLVAHDYGTMRETPSLTQGRVKLKKAEWSFDD